MRMKRLLTFLTLLTLFIGVGWAAETEFYTLDGTQTVGQNDPYNAYAKASDVTQGGISWDVYANTTMNPWRIGGKSLSSVDREVYSKTAMGSAISKVSLTVGTAQNITVNSLKLIVASDASFTNQIDVVSASFAANSTINFTPTSGTEWATGAYYKFVFNVTVSGSSNRFVQFIGATFYKNEGGTVTPTVQTPVIAINPSSGPYYVGDNVTASITCGTDGASIQYQINDGSWTNYTAGSNITIPTTTAGTVTIKAKATKADYIDSGEATQTITITPAATTFDNLADVNTCDDNTEFTFTAQTVVLAKNNKNMYIVMPDNSAGSLIYDATSNWPNTYVYGQVINSGWSGTKAVYRDKPEVTNPSNFVLTGTDVEVTPIVITSDADLTKPNFGRYAVIKNVQVAANGSVTGLTTYNQFGLSFTNFVAGKYDVYGVIGWDNGGGDGTGSGQFMPTEFVEHEAAYTITVNQPSEGGSISADAATADEGEEITLSATPNAGYELSAWIVKDANNNDVTVTGNKFTMPASNVTVTATFSKIKYAVAVNVTPANSGEVWVLGGCTVENNVSVSTIGTTVTVKLHTYDGYQVEGIIVKDASDNEIEATLTNTEGDGNTYTFVMPASAVTVTGQFRTYVSDLYILGTANGNGWAGNVGVKMDYSSSTEKYTKDVYFAGNSSDGAYGFFNFTERLGNADWSGMGTRYGSKVQDQYDLEANNYTGELSWWDEHKGNAFKVPAGIYTIEVNKDKSQVTVTPKAINLTFTPAEGEVVSGAEVTVSSNLYDLLHAINSSIEESAVSNEVKTDGEYAASVTLTADANVTGRAKYGYIEKTATASYTIMQENTSTQYQLIKNTDALVAGKKYLLVSESGPYAYIGGKLGENIEVVDHVTDISGTNGPNVKILILGSETIEGTTYYNFSYTDDGDTYYLANVSAVNDGIGTTTELNDNARWTVTAIVSESGNATIINKATGRHLRAYKNGLDFRSYTGASNQTVQLYRQTENTIIPTVATPEFNPGTGTYSSTQNVTITCATQGATILYSTDGENFTEYTAPISVSETSTLYAKATKDGYNDSEVASATYTFMQPGSDVYVLVTSSAQLIEGNEYVIVAATDNHDRALGAISSSSGEPALGFTNVEDHSTITLTENSDVNVLTLGKEGTGDYCWTFKQKNNKYIYAETSGNRINENGGDSYSNLFYISINPGNYNDIHYATIQAGGGHQIMYNGSSFRHWASSNLSTTPGTYKNVYLYTKGAVVETPTEATLAQIITLGENADGKLYKISNEDGLLGVYSQGQSVWFKDEYPEQAVDYQDPLENTNYKYYTVVEDALEINKSEKDFDQSNWIEVVFQDNASYNNKYVKNLTGTYSWQNGNPKLTLTVDVDETNDVTDVPVGALAYDLNPYMAANFAGTQDGTIQGETHTYFFSKPKAQEYAQILWAVWDGSKFNMPTTNNAYGFTGSFTVSDELNGGVSLDGLQQGETYNFKAVIRKTASKAGSYEVYPTDLNPGVVTGVGMINVNGNVKSVKYVNVAGIVSDVPFQGVNIVVTEYTDGTRTTTKMLKK